MYTKIQVVLDAAEAKLALGRTTPSGQLDRNARPGGQRVLRQLIAAARIGLK